MKIGWISSSLPYLPSRGGFRISGANLIKRLSKRHTIDLIAILREDDANHLDWVAPYCESVATFPLRQRSVAARAANFVSTYAVGKQLNARAEMHGEANRGFQSKQWDVLHVEGGFAGGVVPAELPLAKVLSVHDAEVLRAEEMLHCELSFRQKMNYRLRKITEPRYERFVYPRYERCVVFAERDREFNERLIPEAKFTVIPNGIDLDFYQPQPVEKQPATLVFHGHLSYPPNVQAALEFANEVFPLIQAQVPGAVFSLVGASPAPEIRALASRPGITLAADLPDLRAALCAAAVYVCPVRFGTGIKNKILEAMALGLPIVGYPGSTAGIDCASGTHLFVVNEPQEFANQVLALLSAPGVATRIARAGRRLVEEKYSWEARAAEYERLYEQVIAERRAAGNGHRRS
jgi:glycosyltransferase involved in cell wall biosynthesis